MNKPVRLDINEFNYDLPEEKIARFPLPDRDDSKLLVYDGCNISTHVFRELPSFLDRSHKLIFNNTRVVQARLKFKKETGSTIEIFLLEPHDPDDYALSFSSQNENTWICLVGNAGKWKNEPLIKKFEFNGRTITLKAIRKIKTGIAYLILFTWDDQKICFSEIISHAGLTPIPPYLNREVVPEDINRYQTIYSRHEGSVAAPTAGLHFTDELMEVLNHKGINKIQLTLHVGAGTFIPVKTEDALSHEMHTEQIFINHKCIEDLYHSVNKNIAIGTTSVRALESLYWIGLKIIRKMPEKGPLILDQWESYENHENVSRKQSMKSILNYLDKNKLEQVHMATKMMIVPGYAFRMTDGFLTNFHQPKSTLLLLVAAFTGDDWREIYHYALNHQFRFLSYGDSSLIMKKHV